MYIHGTSFISWSSCPVLPRAISVYKVLQQSPRLLCFVCNVFVSLSLCLEVPPFRRLFRAPLHFCISHYWQWIYLTEKGGGSHIFNTDLNPQVQHTRQWPWISDSSSSSYQILELEARATLPGLHSPSNEHKTLCLLDKHSTNWATVTAHHSCIPHEILHVAPTMAPGTDLTGTARKWRKKKKKCMDSQKC